MNDLASEFFYDGIARIPAGLLVIALYWRTETENLFHAHRNFFSSPILFIVCVLAIAWILGVMIEALIFVSGAYFIKFSYWLSRKCFNKFCKVNEFLSGLHLRLLREPAADKSLTKNEKIAALENELAMLKERKSNKRMEPYQTQTSDNDLEREKRRQDYFRVAMLVMSRDLWFVCLLAFITYYLHPYSWLPRPETFFEPSLDKKLLLGGACAFFCEWLLLMNFVIKTNKSTKETSSQ